MDWPVTGSGVRTDGWTADTEVSCIWPVQRQQKSTDLRVDGQSRSAQMTVYDSVQIQHERGRLAPKSSGIPTPYFFAPLPSLPSFTPFFFPYMSLPFFPPLPPYFLIWPLAPSNSVWAARPSPNLIRRTSDVIIIQFVAH